ncbi:MAG TPA: PhzF family phenazine biosynthesis protein [Fervidobacterium sp.]|nr:PhzF family phenazine biosynthesis protein [Fervidobacterium sp.]HPT54252.1 PhzF family phenazine biosynthesis protein [Fervidobacterium sp.]
MRLFIVDAFTDKPFTGNQAGVVVLEDDDEVSTQTMQSLAAELRYSETAFVRKSEVDGDADFELLYFTPVSEIELCGHATIASFSVLRHLGMATAGHVYRASTKAGIMEITVESDIVMMEQGEPQCGEPLSADEITQIAKLLGIDTEEIGDERFALLPAPVTTGLWDLMIPVRHKATLFSITPDFDGIEEYSRANEIVSFHVFTLDENRALANCRDFAPLYGIPEESATGTANGALIYYLFDRGIVEAEKTYKIIQGETMNRASEIHAKVSLKGNMYRASVGGKAKIIAEGNLLL